MEKIIAIQDIIPHKKKTITTSAEKIIRLRKKYRLTQSDLAGASLNRTLISYIENKKINLTESAALMIAENVNQILEARDVDTKITKDELIVDMDAEIQNLSSRYIMKLKQLIADKEAISNEFLIEVEEFLYDKAILDGKGDIFELVGDAYKNTRPPQREHSYIYYVKAFEAYVLSNSFDRLAEIVIKIGDNRIESKEYHDLIKCMTLFVGAVKNVDINKIVPDGTVYRVYSNWAMAYNGLGKHDFALRIYDNALKMTAEENSEERARFLVEMGQCYELGNEFEQAADCFKIALKIFEECHNFSEYSFVLAKSMNGMLKNTKLSEKGKMFKLEQMTSEMLIVTKYVDSLDTNIFRNYTMLGKSFDFLGEEEKAVEYIKIGWKNAINSRLSKNVSDMISESYSMIKKYCLVESLVCDEFTSILKELDRQDEDLSEAVFALVGLLVSENKGQRAMLLVKSFMQNEVYIKTAIGA